MDIQQIKDYLKHCTELAHNRLGFTAPNPAVGAIIVQGGSIIAKGVHHKAGEPHAEVMAFRAAGERDFSSASLFVSLEPCCHQGRTPPCTEAIIRSGIKQVYFAHQDQNPAVAGQSKAILEQAGVQAEFVPLTEAQALYRYYDYWRQHNKPWVTSKLAISRDGCYKSDDGSPIAITGEGCRQFTHQQRLHADAIITTIETVITDDPQLNVRLDQCSIAKPVIVLDRQLKMPLDARLWQTANPLIICHQDAVSSAQLQPYRAAGAQLIAVPSFDGHISWSSLMLELGDRGMHHVWLEAGARLYRALWQSQLLQQVYLYVGQTINGNRKNSAQLTDVLDAYQLIRLQSDVSVDDCILLFDALLSHR